MQKTSAISDKNEETTMSKTQQPIHAGRREFVAGLGAAALVAALPARALAAPADINVGVILPLSGANAQFGINSARGWNWPRMKSTRPAASRRWVASGSSWWWPTRLRSPRRPPRWRSA